MSFRKYAFGLLVFGIAGFGAGCQTDPQSRHDLALSIAQGGRMSAERSSISAPLPVLAYTRLREDGAPARIYIEGDGLAFLSRTRKSPDPTPTNPIALRLAALDPTNNVAWIGRACQYAGTGEDGGQCRAQYWTTARFAPEAVDAVERELEALKQAHHIPSFELVGFSGGGAIAALLAARRDDVTCLRTVAGNIDHTAFSDVHNTTPLDGSLNPVDRPGRLTALPNSLRRRRGQDRTARRGLVLPPQNRPQRPFPHLGRAGRDP